jgi:hypothetical protein
MTNPIENTARKEMPRRKLLAKYRKLKSWRKLEEQIGVNHFYIYQYAVNGIEPTNVEIAKKLGIVHRRHRTINEHLKNDLIQDMPTAILRLAYENRQEMTNG